MGWTGWIGIGLGAGPARAGGPDQVGHRRVVVPAAQVHADLVGAPPRQPGRTVEVDPLGLGDERVPRAEHPRADLLAPGVGHALVSSHDRRVPTPPPARDEMPATRHGTAAHPPG